jgi:MFS family permease
VVRNFTGLIICRFLVGVFESGFVASAVVYFSTFYTRRQIALRIGIFYASSVTASAFGGLLAYGVFHIPDGAYLYTWSYLFLLEGSLTIATAIIACVVLPCDIETAYFLTENEKRAGSTHHLLDVQKVNTSGRKINWRDAISEFKSWHFPVRVMIGFTFGTLLNSNANFLAIMTGRLGYSVVKTNLVRAIQCVCN